MKKANSLTNLLVKKAMRRQVICLEKDKTIGHGVNIIIKHKVNALLTVDGTGLPVGVVSKTDIMGAYYAGLPIDSPLEYIMLSPPLFCRTVDSLESALEQMRTNRVYRLYVTDDQTEELVGTLAYPDIVGLLYQFCHRCEYSHLFRKKSTDITENVMRFTVGELMTPGVRSLPMDESVTTVMEVLSAYRFGALLLIDESEQPIGVVSKTNLALSYKHGIDPAIAAHNIMSTPVHTCEADTLLEDAIRTMIVADIHRLFVSKDNTGSIVGVLSLTDAARSRSGSCHGCVSSRIKVEEQQ